MDRFADSTHRPWPLPKGPWIMAQTWHELLFAHWALPASELRPLVPDGVELDLWEGQAWLGLVVFRLSGVRLRGTPPLAPVSHFPEINVRTYVRHEGKPGVLFLSLDANNRGAMALARPWFRLPYLYSQISFARTPGGVSFRSRRAQHGRPSSEFAAEYGPCGPVEYAAPGSLAAWLTERYCYYTATRTGRLYRCEIHHAPWPLQPATAQITTNTMAAGHGLSQPTTPPLLHYAHHIQARIWPLARLEDQWSVVSGQWSGRRVLS